MGGGGGGGGRGDPFNVLVFPPFPAVISYFPPRLKPQPLSKQRLSGRERYTFS